jgi:alpha-1,6-mannosyltransferase
VLILTAAGLLMAVSFLGMVYLGNLLGRIVPFQWLSGLAWVGYVVALWWLLPRTRHWKKGRLQQGLLLIVVFGLLFRLILLFTTPPTLSDDVYRYMWDGRLANAGINPYAYPVDSPELNGLDSPERALVNHRWMASPYLPVAQALFALVYRITPGNPQAFQVAAVMFDLLIAWMIIDLLRRMSRPAVWVLIYLWNPLSVVESAHGAHVDAWMIVLIMAAFWLWIAARSSLLSALALAAATLTKGIPGLLLPVLGRRWGAVQAVTYVLLLVAACLPLARGAGWGLTGPLDGTGVFGALRIYARQWNYNSGLYHWLEVALTGYRTPGAVPPQAVGWEPILTAKLIIAAALVVVLIVAWQAGRYGLGDLGSLRLALLPLGAYLVLTTTVHPWYVTLILPFLPFLLSRPGSKSDAERFLWPWLYLSAAVSLSYLSYLDPANLREYDVVRLIEYLPFYGLLIWAVWPTIAGALKPAQG